MPRLIILFAVLLRSIFPGLHAVNLPRSLSNVQLVQPGGAAKILLDRAKRNIARLEGEISKEFQARRKRESEIDEHKPTRRKQRESHKTDRFLPSPPRERYPPIAGVHNSLCMFTHDHSDHRPGCGVLLSSLYPFYGDQPLQHFVVLVPASNSNFRI